MAQNSSRFMTLWIAIAVSNAVRMSYVPPAQSQTFVKLPITKSTLNASIDLQGGRPDQPLFSYYGIEYMVEAAVGTPPQKVWFTLDTGSSDTWVFTPESCCKQKECCQSSFDSSQSETFHELQPASNVTVGYGDESFIIGTYALEKIGLGDLVIENQRVITANRIGFKRFLTGIMGVGFNATERDASLGNPAYPTILDNMISQGLIESETFSLYLDNMDSPTGSVFFGGYDPNKFRHPMYIFPILTGNNPQHYYSVALDSIGFTGVDGNQSTQSVSPDAQFLLDSGCTISIFPSHVMDALVDRLQATKRLGDGVATYEVDCSYRETSGTVDFRFLNQESPLITIPFSEFIKAELDGTCTLGATYPPESAGGMSVLGDTFLRSAYVIYDLKNDVIGIAPAKYDMDESIGKSLGKEGVFGLEGAVDMSGRPSSGPPSPEPQSPTGDLWKDNVCSGAVTTGRSRSQKSVAIVAIINVAVVRLLAQFGVWF